MEEDIPLTKADIAAKGDATLGSAWREVKILKILTAALTSRKCPNLPMYYHHATCTHTDTSQFENKNIRASFDKQAKVKALEKKDYSAKGLTKIEKSLLKRLRRNTRAYTDQSLIVFNELSDMDLGAWIEESARIASIEQLEVLLFQILAGIKACHSNGIIHFDLHDQNVLVTTIDPGGYYRYLIKGKTYYIPLHTELPKIWDFGRSLIVGSDSEDRIIKKALDYYDYFIGTFSNEDLDIIRENLGHAFDKYIKYVYSFDVFRICTCMRTGIMTHTARKALVPFIRLIDRIIEDTEYDLYNGLLMERPEGSTRGRPEDVIARYFSKFLKPPPEGKKEHVINKVTVFEP